MFKKVLIFGLVAVVVVAVAVSAYNVVAGSTNSDQGNLASSDTAIVAPLADPQASTRAQGKGSAAGAADQGSGWQGGSATQNAGQGNRYGQNGQGQGGQGQGGQGQGGQGQGGQGQGGQGQGGQGQGGRGQGQAASQGAGAQQGVPNPQAAQNETVTLNGVVSNYAAPNFTLVTDDGQSVAVQLGNQRYVSNQGIVLQEGEAVTLVGFYETSDSFAVSQITLDASGQTIALRDLTTGRPLWAGGGNNH